MSMMSMTKSMAAAVLLVLLQALVWSTVCAAGFWGQPNHDAQKSGVNTELAYLPPSDSPDRFPGLLLSVLLEGVVRQVVVDSQGIATLLTDSGTCWQYVPGAEALASCAYAGQSGVLQEALYTVGAYRLRRYDAGVLTWEIANMEFVRVTLIDTKDRPFVSGNNVTLVSATGEILLQLPSAVTVPSLALSPDEETLYYQTSLTGMEARSVASGALLWSLNFDNTIESFKTAGSVVIVDTITSLIFVQSNGTIIRVFDAVEGINTVLLYPDRMLVNRDRKILAYSLIDYTLLYQLDGDFDFVDVTCGVKDVFFVGDRATIYAFKVEDGSAVWNFRLNRDVNRLVAGGDGRLIAISGDEFQVISVFTSDEQAKEAFPLWFLGWIIPLVLLFVFFIFFVYRLNTRKPGYEAIN